MSDNTDSSGLLRVAGQLLGLVKKDEPPETGPTEPVVRPTIPDNGHLQKTADPPVNDQLAKTILVEAMGDETGVLACFMGVLEELQTDPMDERQRIRVALRACGAKAADISQGLRNAKDISLPKQEQAFKDGTVHSDTLELETLARALQEKRSQVQSCEAQLAELQANLETLRREVLQDETAAEQKREEAMARAKEFSQAIGSARNHIASLMGQLLQIQ